MLQDSLNLLRSQYLGLNRILSTLSELVNDTVYLNDETAIIDHAVELLIHNHNFNFVSVCIGEREQFDFVRANSLQNLLRDDIDPLKEPAAITCRELAEQHRQCAQLGLIKHEIGDHFFFSLPMQYEQRQLGYVVASAPSFNQNHEKFLPMFSGVLTSLMMNKRQQARLAEGIERRSMELESAWALANKSRQAKNSFLSSVSHEYLTPLSQINNASAVLLETGLSAEQSQAVQTIVDSVRDLQEKVSGSLDYAQGESSDTKQQADHLELNTLVREVSERFRTRHLDSKIEFQVSADEIPEVDLDCHPVKEILNHLLSNAAKFTDEGVIEISMKLRRSEGRLLTIEFRVSDTGMGIAPSDQANIFRLFVSENASPGTPPGAGMGLALCQRLAHSLGSEIVVTSALGKGSTFHFTIKVARTEAPVSVGLPVDHALSERLSVLLVEDNIVNQKLAAKLLENMGCEVDVANDGVDAVDKFTQAEYDVVFMDCQMPNMDGFEATSKIRELESDNRTPIIALTANSLPEDRAKSFNAGMDEFLTKPVAKEKLKQALHRWSS